MYKSHHAEGLKWVSAENGRLSIHNEEKVFPDHLKHVPVNLISIFGRARQGKSFLMNCLADEKEVFTVSNEKDSCTQGIDISTKFMSLSEFAIVDGGRPISLTGNSTTNTPSAPSGRPSLLSRSSVSNTSAPTSNHSANSPSSIRIGFCDAEGQGDKDVTYDANLICPALLASRIAIFNWKGDLQKDHILSTLGIMTRAAQNVNLETNANNAKKFGHLHIVFRDWQATETNPARVFDALFAQETVAEASTRNQIRRDVLAAFESVRVWLFDPPSELVKDLRSRMTLDRASETFRSQLREFRFVLADQLRTPMVVGGQILTGRTLPYMLASVVDTLNRGEVVLPASAYVSMMKDELAQARKDYELVVADRARQLVASLDASQTQTSYPTVEEAKAEWQNIRESLLEKVQEKLVDIFGETIAPSSRRLYDDFIAFIKTQNEAREAQILNELGANYARWVMLARQRAELFHDNEALRFMSPEVIKAAIPTEARTSLEQRLDALFMQTVSLIGTSPRDSMEYIDAHGLLVKKHETLLERVKQAIIVEELKIQREREERERREREERERREREERERREREERERREREEKERREREERERREREERERREREEKERREREERERREREEKERLEQEDIARREALRTRQELDAQALLSASCNAIEERIPTVLREALVVSPTGFSQSVAERGLNVEYFKIVEGIKERLADGPFVDTVIESFKEHCQRLRGKLLESFTELKTSKTKEGIMEANNTLSERLEELADEWEKASHLDQSDLSQLKSICRQTCVEFLRSVGGWQVDEVRALMENGMDDTSALLATVLGKDIESYVLNEFYQPYAERLNVLIDERANATPPLPMEFQQDEEEDKEEEEEEDTPAPPKPPAKKQTTSTEDQKKRAQLWALQNFGKTVVADGSLTKSTPKSTTNEKKLSKNTSSAAEQKARAQEYARKNFTEDVLAIDAEETEAFHSPPAKRGRAFSPLTNKDHSTKESLSPKTSAALLRQAREEAAKEARAAAAVYAEKAASTVRTRKGK